MRASFTISGLRSSVLLLSPLSTNVAAIVIGNDAEVAISNPLVDYKQCSSGDKEWRICLETEGRVDLFCPTVPSVNFSHMIDGLAYEGSDYSISNATTDCFKCSNVDDKGCETFIAEFLEIKNMNKETAFGDVNDNSTTVFDQLLKYCQLICEGGEEAEECSLNDPCMPGSHFCDAGICKTCPVDLEQCYEDGFVTSTQGKLDCHHCRMQCHSLMEKATVTINGQEIQVIAGEEVIQKSLQNVSGPLIDCSNLLLINEFDCPGAKDHLCLIDISTDDGESDADNRNLREVYMVSMKNGCVAMILAGSGSFTFSYGQSPQIPFVKIQMDGNDTLQVVPGDAGQVQIQVMGTCCTLDPFLTECNNRGLGCGDDQYCELNSFIDRGEYTEGNCVDCPAFEGGEPNPAGCFFAQGQDSGNHWTYYRPEIVESCAISCDATLASGECKFCPAEVSVVDFGVEDKADQCYFCPNKDIQFPDRDVPLFGKNITCDMVQLFFNKLEVHKDSQNCRLAQSVNYICGCEGIGYAGANTSTKQAVLAWLPRVSGILSAMGSLFIIYDSMRTPQKRKKMPNQLISTLSVFDLFGSLAYALTTLPTPAEHYLYGSKGNDSTCVAQGFFIQLGTIACFLSVSQAIFYHLTIVNNWSETKIRKTHLVYALYIVPIVIGLAFAFAGIPFYDNTVVWCNNSAKWWPEIPVIISIILSTAIMGSLCYRVYQNEKRSARYTGGETRLSAMLFKQSCWFVIAFYITWVPYLTLQYMLSSGKGYDYYGLILSAATLVPLQGFWNSFVYIRPRYARDIA